MTWKSSMMAERSSLRLGEVEARMICGFIFCYTVRWRTAS